jgi:hypothetical protein
MRASLIPQTSASADDGRRTLTLLNSWLHQMPIRIDCWRNDLSPTTRGTLRECSAQSGIPTAQVPASADPARDGTAPRTRPAPSTRVCPAKGGASSTQARLARPTQLSTFRCAIAASKVGRRMPAARLLALVLFPLTSGGAHRKQADYCANKQHACVTVLG